MKKSFLYLISILLSISLSGQKITLSQPVATTANKEIAEIRDMWISYLKDCKKSIKYRNITEKYWNSEEFENKFSDIVMYQISPSVPLSLMGENCIFDISEIEDNLFRIRNQVVQENPEGRTVLAIYNVYAKRNSVNYKLYTEFNRSLSILNHFNTDHIDFYYPSGYKFSKKEALKADRFYSCLVKEYGFKADKKLTYIVAANPEEANRYIGFDYSVMSSIYSYAGYYLPSPNIIIAGHPFHKHELVHSVFKSMFPNAPSLFHEGIATYLGGSGGKEMNFHTDQLIKLINSGQIRDISNLDALDFLIDGTSNPFYTTGALLIKYAFENGGTKKVLSLFHYRDTQEDTFKAIEEVLGIKRDEINNFIRSYLGINIRNCI